MIWSRRLLIRRNRGTRATGKPAIRESVLATKQEGKKSDNCGTNGRKGNYCAGPSERSAREFIERRSALHEIFIRETEKTKRLGFGLAAILLMIACIVPVLAPDGREKIAWAISAALFVFSAVSMGYTAVWLKMKRGQLKLTKA